MNAREAKLSLKDFNKWFNFFDGGREASKKELKTCEKFENGKWSYIDGTEWWAYSQNDGLTGTDETKIVWNNDGTGWHDWLTGEDPQGVICQQCQGKCYDKVIDIFFVIKI